ncbi:MAG: hypothetical protein EHM64_09060 [Ignavibacteriae bacterium]|nr:MAG: hypothetical protein EHM64_09060 [Ignavibacteriota bacterium]
MLLVGVTGPVGSGKTSLLLLLTGWFQQQHKGVEGFLALGGARVAAHQGATSYRLQMVATGKNLPYALRGDSKTPPYVFDPETERYLEEWATQLKMHGAPALIVLDEFSALEASGRGHAKLWDSIQSSNPPLVVIAMRNGLVSLIEQSLGVSFDTCVDVQEKDAWDSLRKICVEHEDWKRVGAYGAAAGSFEASVGTMLHTAQVPFRGIALSSVQSMVMTYAGDGLGTRGKVIWVPFISAGLKALSPAGNSLNPMLAISMQGFLFTGAIEMLGWNALGVLLGGFLVGAWAAAQGVILQFIFVGGDVVRMYDMVLQWIAQKLHLPAFGLIGLLLIWTSIAGIISSSLTLYAYRRRQRIPERLQQLIAQGAPYFAVEEKNRSWKSIVHKSVRDVTKPFFWLPLLILIVLILVTGSSLENVFWITVRVATFALVFFSLARAFDPRSFLNWLQKRGYWGPAYAFRLVFLQNHHEKNL